MVYNPWIYSVRKCLAFCFALIYSIYLLLLFIVLHLAGAEQALSKWNEKLF